MNYLHIILVTITIVCLIACCVIGMKQKYESNSKSTFYGFLLIIAGICLIVYLTSNPDTTKTTNINDMTDQELYEYIVELNDTELDAWYETLTNEQQTRVFHVYMMHELETEATNDSFQ